MLQLKATINFKGEPRIFIFEDDITKQEIMKGKVDVLNIINKGITIGGVSWGEDLWLLPTHLEYTFENDFYTTNEVGITGLTELGKYCIDSGLRQLLIPTMVNGRTLLALEECCFQNLPIYFVELPDSLLYIKDKVFRNCPLISIKLSKNIREIGKQVFECCFDLKNIELNSTLRKIGDYAFSNCVDLREIELPNSLQDIGKCIFIGISRIKVKINSPEFDLNCLGISKNQIFFV